MLKSLLTRTKKNLDTVSPAASKRAQKTIDERAAKTAKGIRDRAVGVNNEEDAKHRAHRLFDMGFDEGSSAAELMDSWDIVEMISTVGSGDDALTEIRYLPHPLWDDEAALHRKSYLSYEEAVSHVADLGGKLLAEKSCDR